MVSCKGLLFTSKFFLFTYAIKVIYGKVIQTIGITKREFINLRDVLYQGKKDNARGTKVICPICL